MVVCICECLYLKVTIECVLSICLFMSICVCIYVFMCMCFLCICDFCMRGEVTLHRICLPFYSHFNSLEKNLWHFTRLARFLKFDNSMITWKLKLINNSKHVITLIFYWLKVEISEILKSRQLTRMKEKSSHSTQDLFWLL